jgi:hypothetical protein
MPAHENHHAGIHFPGPFISVFPTIVDPDTVFLAER